MRNTATKEILNYWNGLRGHRPAPLRSEIDPSALRHFLPQLFIVNATIPGQPTFSLAGTRICELFGRELRSREYASVWLGDAHVLPNDILDHVLFYERPALLEIKLSPNGDAYPYELLLMPLRSLGRRSDRVLGALLPQHTALPEISLPISALELQAWCFIRPDGTRAQPAAETTDKTVTSVTFFRRLVGSRIAEIGH